MQRLPVRLVSISVVAGLVIVGCGSPEESVAVDANDVGGAATSEVLETSDDGSSELSGAESVSTYRIEVWADNWMSVWVDGVLIGEDSVPITTERSFNSETFTFEASLPFTVAIEAKDFTETDSGLEYIGEPNQQMGDGGIVAQITDVATGDVVAVTDGEWAALVVHQAPLNTECEDDPDPDSTCEFSIIETPAGWTSSDFDDSAWNNATEWSAAEVSPKDGYAEIDWDPAAQFVWGTDLHVDNTILLRTTVS
jgi:hypothetical protein